MRFQKSYVTRFVESLGFKMPKELEIQKYNHIQNIYKNKFPKELILEKEDYLNLVSNGRYALRDVPEELRDRETDRKSTRLNSSHSAKSRMPSSA